MVVIVVCSYANMLTISPEDAASHSDRYCLFTHPQLLAYTYV